MRGMIMTKPALDKAMMFVAFFQAALRSGTGAGITVCADAGALTPNRTASAVAWRRIEIRRRAEIRFTNNGHTSRVTLSAASPPSQPSRRPRPSKNAKNRVLTRPRAQARAARARWAESTLLALAAVLAVGLRELCPKNVSKGLLLLSELIIDRAVCLPDGFVASFGAIQSKVRLEIGLAFDVFRRQLFEQASDALHDAIEQGNLMDHQVCENLLDGLRGIHRAVAPVEQRSGQFRWLSRRIRSQIG